MNAELLERVKLSAPQWLRYLLTLSGIAASGEGWVVASGDDVALFDADGTAVMPLWPSAGLAKEAQFEGAGPTAVGAQELIDRLLPSLGASDALVAVFPAEGDNTLVAPDTVARDIAGFSADPRDIAAEIVAEPQAVLLDDLALLDAPDMSDVSGCEPGEAAYWVLSATGGEAAVVGVVHADKPSILLFSDEPHALAFRTRTDAPATPTALSAQALLGGWLLLAFSAGWGIAIVDDALGAMAETPARLALELAERQAHA